MPEGHVCDIFYVTSSSFFLPAGKEGLARNILRAKAINSNSNQDVTTILVE